MKTMVLLAFILLNFCLLANESVVCIHGFSRSYRSMIPMGNILEKEGYDVYLWDYPSRRETIEGHADNLVKLLKVIAKNNPGEPIHFVTHSLGGIITKTALNRPGCPEEAKIGKAILLAPPAQGSQAARTIGVYKPIRVFFGEKAGMQLLTYSPEDMVHLGDFPPTKKVLVIAGIKGNHLFFKVPNDGKVALHETRLNTPHHFYTVFANHSWIMTSRHTIILTKKFLQD